MAVLQFRYPTLHILCYYLVRKFCLCEFTFAVSVFVHCRLLQVQGTFSLPVIGKMGSVHDLLDENTFHCHRCCLFKSYYCYMNYHHHHLLLLTRQHYYCYYYFLDYNCCWFYQHYYYYYCYHC